MIYAREGRRAFFIGGIAGGAAPYLALVLYTLAVSFDGWRYFGSRSFGRGGFGDAQLLNLFASFIIFAPNLLALFGGWVAMAVYRSCQPPKAPLHTSPFREANPPGGAHENRERTRP